MSTGVCQTPIVGGPVSSMVSALVQSLLAAQCALSSPAAWPGDSGSTILSSGSIDPYDFVIIGGSATGSVLGSRLSENPQWKVLVLEAGDNPPPEAEVPALFVAVDSGANIERYLSTGETQACQGTKAKACMWPNQKLMGGSSSTDLSLSSRGTRAKFESWNVAGWSFENVTKFYALSEKFVKSAPLTEYEQYDDFRIAEMIIHGGKELGLKFLRSPSDNSKAGYGFLKGHIVDGRRVSAGKTYMSSVRSRPNLQVIKNAYATKINFASDKTIQSVSFEVNSQPYTVDVRKEAILGAGLLNNPKLLMLSGIGPTDQLARVGIPQIVESPGVGQNLQDIVTVPVIFKILPGMARPKTALDAETDLYYYLTSNYGPLSTIGLSALNGFINSDPVCAFKDCDGPDVVLNHFFSQRNSDGLSYWYTSVGLNDQIVESIVEANKDAHLLVTFLSLHDVESAGSVELSSNSVSDQLTLRSNYLSADGDVQKLLQATNFLRRLERTRAYRDFNASILKLDIPECDEFIFKTEPYWRCYIKYMSQTLMSQTLMAPSGTTRMGDDSDSVVDSELRVRGVQGLRVVGSSVYPSPIQGSDTMAMMGELLASAMKSKWTR